MKYLLMVHPLQACIEMESEEALAKAVAEYRALGDTQAQGFISAQEAAYRAERYADSRVNALIQSLPSAPTTPPEDFKPTNPKDLVADTKFPPHLWPPAATAYGTAGLYSGMLKYGRANWREMGVSYTVYLNAILRHAFDLLEGNDTDPQDDLHNLSGILASAAILVDSMELGNLNDDRNYRGESYRRARQYCEDMMHSLRELHAGKNPKHYTIADEKTRDEDDIPF